MTRVLTLDAALARFGAAIVVDGRVIATASVIRERDGTDPLPGLVVSVLQDADMPPDQLDAIAVTVGPGSFTGIRGALALAHGIGLSASVPVIGVTTGEAIAAGLPDVLARAVWIAIDSPRQRVFLVRAGTVAAWELDALPLPGGPVAIAGDASFQVAARLAAKGYDVMLCDARLPSPVGIAAAAALRLDGTLPPLSAQPLYIDPPAVRLPARGLRAPPA